MITPRDWSDALSPVVVKEIRQGVRGKVFVGAFLITQLLMVFLIFLGVLQAAEGDDLAGWNGFFWTLVGLPLLIIMPARGLQAVGSEIRDGTIDLVFLSKLSAWRIVVGKWAALSAQSALLVSSLMPYIVLRYFVGRVNLLQELLVLGLIFVGSMLLAAGAVALSAFQPRGQKSGNVVSGLILVVVIVFGFITLVSMMFGMATGARRGGISGSDFLEIYLAAGLLGPILGVFLLQFGASKIAPAAENHALRKRLTAFAGLFLAAGLSLFDVARPLPFVFASIIMGITVIDAVCEPIPRIYSIYLPFVKRGAFGRFIGRALYPGWASGSIFSFIAVTSIYAWAAVHPDMSGDLELSAYLATLGIIFFPLALIRLVRPNLERPLAAYCAIQAITAVVSSVAIVISEVLDNDALSMIISVIPLAYAIVESSDVNGAKTIFYTGGSALLVASFVVLAWRIYGAFRQTEEMLAEFAAGSQVVSDGESSTVEHRGLPPQSFSERSATVQSTRTPSSPPLPADSVVESAVGEPERETPAAGGTD